MSMTRNLLMAAGVALGVSFAGVASAQPYLAPGVQNTISDDYGERIWDRDGSGTITAGDVFLGVIGMTSSSPQGFLNGTGQVPQVTGIFGASVVGVAGGALALAPISAAELAPTLAAGTFGLTAGQQAFIAALPNAGAGGVAWLFEGPVADFFNLGDHTSFSDGVARATDGSLVLVVGRDLSPGESMGAFGDDLTIPPGAGLSGVFTWNLSVLQENWPDIIGFGILPTGTEFRITGSVAACNSIHTDSCNAYQYAADATATFIPIPEPATLAMFGAGLFGLGAILRRRREQV